MDFRSILTKVRSKLRNSQLRNKIIRITHKFKLSSVYYLLISNAFKGEQKRVLCGISQYYKDVDAPFLLRRNTHRLEKGLIMQPRRNVFAESYILETVKAFDVYSTSLEPDRNLITWSHNILKSYFSVVDITNIIEESKNIFDHSLEKANIALDNSISVPFKRGDSQTSNVSYDDLLKLSLRRRSIRWFQNKTVERDLIDAAIRVSLLSPSACNRQPFRYQIFDEPSIVKSVINIPGGTAGWSHSPPAVVALIGQLNAFSEERDKHVIYIDSCLSAMSFMYALETLGLGSCAINFPDIPSYHKKIQSVANLQSFETTIMLIALGYPDDEALVPSSVKKTLENIRSYNIN